MPMKNSITSKLLAYTALSSAYCGVLSAQVNYVDIDPDIVLDVDGEVFELDLNGDLIKDFRFRKVMISTDINTFTTLLGEQFPAIEYINHIYGSALGANAIAGELSPYSFKYPYVLDEGDTICDNINWLGGNSQSLVYSFRYLLETASGMFENYQINADGNWFGGETDKFAALRLQIGGDQLYGWVRFDVTANNDSLIIKDFGYSTVSADCIYAYEPIYVPTDTTDDTTDVMIDKIFEDMSIYSFMNTVVIQTENIDLVQNAFVEIFAITGKRVYSGKLESQSEKITLGNIANGIYLIKITSDDHYFEKKLFIQQ